MGKQNRQKSDKEDARNRHPAVSDTDDLLHGADPNAALPPNAIMQLQRTIGNQAVQRLISGERQHDFGNGVLPANSIQRQPTVGQDPGQPQDGGGTQKEASLPSCLATIATDRQGTIRGASRIAGHEGKIEVLSFSLEQAESRSILKLSRFVDESSPLLLKSGRDRDSVKTALFEFIRPDEGGTMKTESTLRFDKGEFTSYELGEPGSNPNEKHHEKITMKFPKGSS